MISKIIRWHWNNRGKSIMKRLYIIGGTMGVGKTATCRVLQKRLDNSVLHIKWECKLCCGR